MFTGTTKVASHISNYAYYYYLVECNSEILVVASDHSRADIYRLQFID
jgi:hypothetical protein